MKKKKTIVILSIGSIISMFLVVGLYLLSEDIIHRQRDVFIRRYPHHIANQENALDLGYNSYYIAGVADGKIYLGNRSAPAHLVVLDTTLKDTTHVKINIADTELRFNKPVIRVNPPNFFVLDGKAAIVLKGNTSNWIASLMLKDKAYFSKVEPMGNSSFALLAKSAATKENVLGKISVNDSVEVNLYPNLLQKQIDGVFCTDGMLLYEREIQKLIYVYYYRNEFIVADANLKQEYIGKTIDTISKAQIKVENIQSENSYTLGGQPLVVNKQSFIYKNYLFISSNMLGKYENASMLNQASIIDVYDINDNTYKFSFYLYKYKLKKLYEFQVYDNLVIAIEDKYIVTHKLRKTPFEGMKLAEKKTDFK